MNSYGFPPLFLIKINGLSIVCCSRDMNKCRTVNENECRTVARREKPGECTSLTGVMVCGSVPWVELNISEEKVCE